MQRYSSGRGILRALPSLRRRQTVRRLVSAAASTVQHQEPTAPFPSHPLPVNTERRRAIRDAKPFSDFLTDTFNRQHDYLRISVTERCNLRCLYCMPEEGVPLSPQAHLLTTPEIFYLSSLFVSQGVTKIRLTGGEPTVRPDIVPLMQQIGSLRSKGLRELALTTNGISLHRKLDKMVEAGLTGLNISLDTLDPFQFQILTRRKGFEAVMRSIDRVLETNRLGAGIKLKVNCVVMRGINDREIIPFVEMGREKDIEVRFIEYMPFDGNKWSERKMLPYGEMLDMIRGKYPGLRKVEGHFNDTSKTYEVPGFVGKLGFITSMTHNFCGSCNRLRITGDGNLKVCLFGNAEVSLRDLMRKDNNNQPIDQAAFEAIKELEMNRRQGLVEATGPQWIDREAELLDVIGMAVKRKKEKHAGIGELENMKNRPMILIAERKETGHMEVSRVKRMARSPVLSANSWSQIPLHLLHSNVSNTSHARLYSTSSASRREAQVSNAEETSTHEVHDEKNYNADAEAELMVDVKDGAVPAFQSLGALFPERMHAADSPLLSTGTRSEAEPESSPTKSPSSDREALTLESERRSNLRANTSNDRRASLQDKATKPVSEHQSNSASREGGANPSNTTLAPSEKSEYQVYRPTHFQHSHKGSRKAMGSDDGNSLRAPWELPRDAATSPSSILDPNATANLGAVSNDPLPLPVTSKRSGSPTLTHVTSTGEAQMVDVSRKPSTHRSATALNFIRFSNPETLELIKENSIKKGDVLGVARVAGIMAAKRCSDLIPLCHPLALSKVGIKFYMVEPQERITWVRSSKKRAGGGVVIEAKVDCFGPTGVEMEALTAVSVAALTVFDMCKAVDRDMLIDSAAVILKTGGASGTTADSDLQRIESWMNTKPSH
ncbi:hypothetical protein AAFC00_003072 [Neodothiora populina]